VGAGRCGSGGTALVKLVDPAVEEMVQSEMVALMTRGDKPHPCKNRKNGAPNFKDAVGDYFGTLIVTERCRL